MGFLLFILYPASAPPPPPPLCHTQLAHTQLCHTPSFNTNFTQLAHTHTTLSHTIFQHKLCHNYVTHHLLTQASHNLLTHTHNFVIHHLPTQTLSQLCHTHTLSFTHNLLTHKFVRHHLSHTIFHPQLCHTPSLRGSGLGLVARLGTRWLPSAPRHFAWQAWHLATSACVLRGRRSAYGTGLGLVALSRSGRRGTLRGRRGTWRHPPALCVAGVALGDIHLHFAWQAQQWAGSGDALGAL